MSVRHSHTVYARFIFSVCALAAVVIGALFLVPTRPAPTVSPLPAGVETAWWDRAAADLAAREYHASPLGDGWQAPNRAHGLRAVFRPDGVRIMPRGENEQAWQWTWSLQAWGRGDQRQAAADRTPTADGSRVTYAQPGFTEWYVNGPDGLEQGFTVDARPAGDGPLLIEGAVGGGLAARGGGSDLCFVAADGSAVLDYGTLHAWDARARELPAEIAWNDGTLALRIDDRGAVYPVTIDPILTAPTWAEDGDNTDAEFGWCVATAGDVNGDGYGDIVVGSPNYYSFILDMSPGKAWVYAGSAAGLENEPLWEVLGEQDGDQFGYSVACAGDIDNDGYDDIIVGAPNHYDPAGWGRAYVFCGGPGGPSAVPCWADDPDGPESRFTFGVSVSTAGDINGDGYDDVLVGDPGLNTGHGRLSVFHGGPGGLGATADWFFTGPVADGFLGTSVSSAGDIDGDGYDDIVAGAPQYGNGHGFEGAVYVFRGGADGLGHTPQVIESNIPYLMMGQVVSLAGDVNGDGYADVLVGCVAEPDFCTEGPQVRLFRGTATGLDAAPAWTWGAHLAEPLLGMDMAAGGDVNGDGYADLLIGDRRYGDNEGRIMLFYGGFEGPGTTYDWVAIGTQDGAELSRVATAGDVDGDGFSDVLGGAPFHDSFSLDRGRVSCWHGGPEGLRRTPGWVTESNQESAFYGMVVAAAGDVSGDGYDDLLVGAPWYDHGEKDEGAVFLYLGSRVGPAATPLWWAEGDCVDARFGTSVASAGDVNGDGLTDILVGAPWYMRDAVRGGAVFLWHSALGGGPYGNPGNATWQYHGGQPASDLGMSVASAGDVNGDGYADIIVGAPYYDNGTTDEGMVFAFHGSADGLPDEPDWSRDTGRTGTEFGFCVASAGDFNGDGFSDVIVGAPGYDHPSDREGLVFVYVGSTGGLQTDAPWWYAQSDQVGADLGYCVASAGDVNGDGCADVIVGAPYHDGAFADEGLALVWYGDRVRPVSGTVANADWSAVFAATEADFGCSVASAGDVNGDGFSDVIVGAPGVSFNAVNGSGLAQLFLGSAAGLTSPYCDWFDGGANFFARYGWSVAGAGDLNGDGFGDVVVGSPGYSGEQSSEGRAYLYWGGNHRGLARTPRMWHADLTTRLAPLGRASSRTAFGLGARLRSPAGRDEVRLECEVKPYTFAFDGVGTVMGVATDTGAPAGAAGSVSERALVVEGLPADALLHWRLRLVSTNPFFPRSPWLTQAGNGAAEWDLRLAGPLSAVGDTPRPLESGLACAPNPCNPATTFTWTMAHESRVRLRLFDARGRLVRSLVDEQRDLGAQTAFWDGRDDAGRTLASGLYLARMEIGDAVHRTKVMLTK